MGVPVYSTGQVLAASDVNSWFVPLAGYKGSDTTITNSTVLANDPDLQITVAANAVYSFTCTLDYEGGTLGASDLKWGWTVPSGTTMRYTRIGVDTAGNSTAGFMTTESATVAAGSAGSGSLKGVIMDGTIAVSSTAGLLLLKWAQNTASLTSTIVHAQSRLIAWRIA